MPVVPLQTKIALDATSSNFTNNLISATLTETARQQLGTHRTFDNIVFALDADVTGTTDWTVTIRYLSPNVKSVQVASVTNITADGLYVLIPSHPWTKIGDIDSPVNNIDLSRCYIVWAEDGGTGSITATVYAIIPDD